MREGAVPKQGRGLRARSARRGQVGLEVDVERRIAALAEGGLHALVVEVGRPVVVDGVRVGLRAEGDVRAAVGGVEHAGLVRDEAGEELGRVQVRLVECRDDVNVHVHEDF